MPVESDWEFVTLVESAWLFEVEVLVVSETESVSAPEVVHASDWLTE
jgi:hypothetical protein